MKMIERSVLILGLPDSGKTTFLAALWHLVTSRDLPLSLTFASLRDGDATYLNAIATRWLTAKKQDRTPQGATQLVSISLRDQDRNEMRLTFPDLSGETYRRMWEERECDAKLIDLFKAGCGILLFVHSDTIAMPDWVVDVVSLARKVGLELPDGEPVPWAPRTSPTQVQLVDILQLLHRPPISINGTKLAVMLSAWDKGTGEGLSPIEFLRQKLPLLHQYLENAGDNWNWRVYGVSAQGGEYEEVKEDAPAIAEARSLRELDVPSERIKLVDETSSSHDLTEPLKWLAT